MRFPPWSLPRVGKGGGKRQFITPGHPLDAGGNVCKRVRLTRKIRPGVSSHSLPDPGHPTPRRWKRLRPPEGVGVRWACLAIFFLDLGLGEVLLWEQALGYSGWSVQPKGPVHWHWFIFIRCICVRVWTDMRALHSVRTTTTSTTTTTSCLTQESPCF